MRACKISVLLRYGVSKWMINKKYRWHRAKKRERRRSIITTTPIDNRLMWRCPMNIQKRKKRFGCTIHCNYDDLYDSHILFLPCVRHPTASQLLRMLHSQNERWAFASSFVSHDLNDQDKHLFVRRVFFLFNNQCNDLHTCARTHLMTSIDDYLFE